MAKNVPGNASGCITIATAFFCTLFSDGKREKHPEREAMAEMQTLPFFSFRNWCIIQVRKTSLSEHWRVETGRRVSSLVRTKPSHGEGRECDGHTRTMGCCCVDLLSRGQCWNPHRQIRCYHLRSSMMRLPHCTGCSINQSHNKCTEGELLKWLIVWRKWSHLGFKEKCLSSELCRQIAAKWLWKSNFASHYL